METATSQKYTKTTPFDALHALQRQNKQLIVQLAEQRELAMQTKNELNRLYAAFRGSQEALLNDSLSWSDTATQTEPQPQARDVQSTIMQMKVHDLEMERSRLIATIAEVKTKQLIIEESVLSSGGVDLLRQSSKCGHEQSADSRALNAENREFGLQRLNGLAKVSEVLRHVHANCETAADALSAAETLMQCAKQLADAARKETSMQTRLLIVERRRADAQERQAAALREQLLETQQARIQEVREYQRIVDAVIHRQQASTAEAATYHFVQ